MNLIGVTIEHIKFGSGTVESHQGDLLTIRLNNGEAIRMVYPDAFKKHLKSNDAAINKIIQEDLRTQEGLQAIKKQQEENRMLQNQRSISNLDEKPKAIVRRENIALKCNYCDGGASADTIGYMGACSDAIIRYNISVKKHTWCSDFECNCHKYLEGQISRRELDSQFEKDGFICYESKMLIDWKAYAGVVRSIENRGRRKTFKKAYPNSFAVLTLRKPNEPERRRLIFAAFLIGEAYEGDSKETGYIKACSEYKIILKPQEAEKMLFWKYHKNGTKPEKPTWGQGLHRYFKNDEAVQILRDIVQVKSGTSKENAAENMLEQFCRVNGIGSKRSGSRYVTDTQHMPENHRHQHKMNRYDGSKYRKWAGTVGASTLYVIDSMLKAQHVEETAYRSCMGVLQMEKKYGRERLEAACKRARSIGSATYSTVKNILKNAQDNLTEHPACKPLPAHNNLRGPASFM